MTADALVSDVARGLLVAAFAAAVVEKSQTLINRSAFWHPVLVARRRLRHNASVLLSLSLVADLALIALLVISPAAGGAFSLLLLAAYTVVGMGAHRGDGSGCQCFWKVLNASAIPTFLIRNALLAGLAGLVIWNRPAFSGWGVFGALVLLIVMTVGLKRLDDAISTFRHSMDTQPQESPIGSDADPPSARHHQLMKGSEEVETAW